jgi:hypothetical protein
MRYLLFLVFLSHWSPSSAQIDSFDVRADIKICIDKPFVFKKHKETIICFFALPNGNTIQQTMGKKMQEGDDWHYDIQHIEAQTEFIRKQLPGKNFVVIYLANNYKSWPLWKQKHPNYRREVPSLIDSLVSIIPAKNKTVYLNGHSGGGSFIFGYLDAVEKIPSNIKRISFIDSNYGYDSSYYNKLSEWLQRDKQNHLTVFAYNDSVALYNGKPVVSAKGGTWYRSYLLLQQMSSDFEFEKKREDSLIIYQTQKRNISFIFKTNPERKIFHTQQVELNGFIHSVLLGTKRDEKDYLYFGPRAYTPFIGLITQ